MLKKRHRKMKEKNSFEDILKKYGKLTYTCKGTSMLPMLRPNKDVFTIIQKQQERCKENDVVLFKMNERIVLHRIVEVFNDHYSALGDNCINYENNIKDENILGTLVSFQRNGKDIRINDVRYKIYVFILRFFEKPRIAIKRFLAALKKRFKNYLTFRYK